MTFRWSIFCASIFVAATLQTPTAMSEIFRGFKVVAVGGYVAYRPVFGSRWRPIGRDTILPYGGLIRVGTNAEVTLKAFDVFAATNKHSHLVRINTPFVTRLTASGLKSFQVKTIDINTLLAIAKTQRDKAPSSDKPLDQSWTRWLLDYRNLEKIPEVFRSKSEAKSAGLLDIIYPQKSQSKEFDPDLKTVNIIWDDANRSAGQSYNFYIWRSNESKPRQPTAVVKDNYIHYPVPQPGEYLAQIETQDGKKLSKFLKINIKGLGRDPKSDQDRNQKVDVDLAFSYPRSDTLVFTDKPQASIRIEFEQTELGPEPIDVLGYLQIKPSGQRLKLRDLSPRVLNLPKGNYQISLLAKDGKVVDAIDLAIKNPRDKRQMLAAKFARWQQKPHAALIIWD